jgi:glutamine synthetase
MASPKEALTKEDVLRLAEEQRVRFILLQFTDILGVMKNVSIPVEQLPKALEGQILFDGSSVHGFVRIEESDMLLKPDPATYVSFPWLNGARENTARLICDIYTPDGEPFAGCPRLTLKKVLLEAAAMGYSVNMGPEAEFFPLSWTSTADLPSGPTTKGATSTTRPSTQARLHGETWSSPFKTWVLRLRLLTTRPRRLNMR